MTKKDYELISRVIRERYEMSHDISIRETLFTMTRDIADELQRDNVRFNRERFMTACGLGGL